MNRYIAITCVLWALSSCGKDRVDAGGVLDVGGGHDASGTGRADSSSDQATGAPDFKDRDVFEQPDQIFTFNDMGVVDCNGEPCACNNGEDDDGDGLVDGLDPECTGPYDNDEGSFATGISGDNRDPKWQDCFFDGNSGAGDDKCRYHADCLDPSYQPFGNECEISQDCFEFCRPRTPNGCDCFGCCEVHTDAGTVFVSLDESCSTQTLDQCSQCKQTTECVNTCGECELCFGKTAADLPDTCGSGGSGGAGGGTSHECDDGETPCEDDTQCDGTSQYCLQGCCIFIPG